MLYGFQRHKMIVHESTTFKILLLCFFHFGVRQPQFPFTFIIWERAVTICFKNSPIVFHGRKKVERVGNDLKVSI